MIFGWRRGESERQAGAANTTGLVLIYRGPDEWSDEAKAQEPPPPGRLVEDAEVVDCKLEAGVAFHAAGNHHGGLSSTIHINRDVPFNLADLLYVVAHEGHPGHIAESLLKEIHLVREQGRTEQQVRFLLNPSDQRERARCLVTEQLLPTDLR